jgi:alkylation response protein AidB-like acyl-CoA dehydrogenase
MLKIDSLIDLARELAAQIAPRADEADRAGTLPPEDIALLRDSGYLTASVPGEYGGMGLSMRECVEAQLELAQASGSTAMVATMQMHLFGHARETRPWSHLHFEQFCRAAVDERAIFNGIASEPDLGSPSRGGFFKSTAVSVPGGWVINGHKNWSTGGVHLTHMLVSVSIDDTPSLILVLNHTPGVEWVETWGDSLSLRASDSHDVFFRDVFVPDEHLIVRGHDKTKVAPNAWFPMLVAATYLGVAIAARNSVIQYALERVPTALGKPIATLPAIQRQIGEIDLALQTARLFLLDAAAQWTGEERQRVYPRLIAAKHLATETAINVTEKAMRVAGGAAITHAMPLERYFRDVRAGLAHPPSGDVALEAIGRSAIGIDNQGNPIQAP